MQVNKLRRKTQRCYRVSLYLRLHAADRFGVLKAYLHEKCVEEEVLVGVASLQFVAACSRIITANLGGSGCCR